MFIVQENVIIYFIVPEHVWYSFHGWRVAIRGKYPQPDILRIEVSPFWDKFHLTFFMKRKRTKAYSV